jgi:hypothetical protein
MQTETYLCKDCKHRFVKLSEWPFYIMGFNTIFWTCRKSFIAEHEEPNYVTGSSKVKGRYFGCTSARIGKAREGNCGEGGYYWEPRDKKGLFKLIVKAEQDASASK